MGRNPFNTRSPMLELYKALIKSNEAVSKKSAPKQSKVKPLTAGEITGNLEKIIPESVIKAVNNFLRDRFRGNSVTIKQDELITEILKIDGSLDRTSIFEKKYLDFEPIFQKSGWNVKYDKPGYNESYAAYFEFSPKKKKDDQ